MEKEKTAKQTNPPSSEKRHKIRLHISPKQYIRCFYVTVALLAIIRWTIMPHITQTGNDQSKTTVYKSTIVTANPTTTDSLPKPSEFTFEGEKHKIYSVPNFKNTFPDVQDIQIESALKYGVKSVANRADAERRKKDLVYVGANPYFHIDRLNNSIPYLVPRASMLVQDIGRAFLDSLYVKHIPAHKIIVTSLLRTEEDVKKLRTRNGNATENSCHLYGTTVDICYNRYVTIDAVDGSPRRKVQNDTLKWVLSEVLRDFRDKDRCWVKYEVKQGCFHITVN